MFAAAAQLTSLAGEYPAAQIGNTAYIKLDANLTPHHQLALRLNTTSYWGANNVFSILPVLLLITRSVTTVRNRFPPRPQRFH